MSYIVLSLLKYSIVNTAKIISVVLETENIFSHKSQIASLEIAFVQLSSCVRLFDLMNCSLPGSSVLHYLPEFAQIH